MAQRSNNLEKFWQELKRRKVFKVFAMYAGTAFIILQLVDIIAQPLQLPTWTMTLVIILLCIGFIITLLIAWIYDITPEGIKKTESIEEAKNEESKVILVKRRIKISDIIIVFMAIVIVILLYPKIFNKDKFKDIKDADGRISVAVMPFQNMTNDTTKNFWQKMIQDILITSLANSEELKVRQSESINTYIQSKDLTNYASITPSVASTISQKLDANVFIYGSIITEGDKIRFNAKLIDSKTEEVYKSFQINGIADKIIQTIDSLSIEVKNFLIISKLEKEVSPDFKNLASTNSPEAYRYFNLGNIAFSKRDFPLAAKLLQQSIVIDSNFIYAFLIIPFAYGNQGLYEEAKKWCIRACGKKDQMTMQQKVWVNRIYANYFETPSEDIKYLKQLLEFDDQMPWIYFNIGNDYNDLQQYNKAIIEFEKSLEMYKKWGSKPMWVWNYTQLGYAYHQLRQYKTETELYRKSEQDFPDEPDLIQRQAILSLSQGDSVATNYFIEKLLSILKENSWHDVDIIANLAFIYDEANILDKAEEYYRKAHLLEPENPNRLNSLSWFLINKDRKIDEGLELVDKALNLSPDYYNYLDTKGWGLFKQGKYQEALETLEKSWNLKPRYNHNIYLHLEEAKKAYANQKNN
jgi:tetratricopeptide (TPR) repeat protein